MNKHLFLFLLLLKPFFSFGQANTVSQYFSKDYESDTYNRVSIGYNIAEKGMKIGYERVIGQALGIETGMDFTRVKDVVAGNGFFLDPVSDLSEATLNEEILTDLYLHVKLHLYDNWRLGFKVALFPFISEKITDVGLFMGYHLPLFDRMFLEAEAGFGLRAYNGYYVYGMGIHCPVSAKLGYCF